MTKPIVCVEKLSKSFLLGHKSKRRGGYTALRDVLTRSARNFGRNAWDMARGRQIVQGDEIEEFWALKDLSFDIHQGDVVGIIGRNGAGKSTLLKILSRITEPTQGRVTLRGRVASLLEVGTGFHPELTGRENIFLNGAILGMTRSEIKRKFDEIVAFAEVDKFLDTPVKRYSSGMYVRLAFAVAAHLDPEILVVDEVLAVGDVGFQKKCLGKMKDVSRGGRTVLFVSHNMSAIQTLCGQSILLNRGRLELMGKTQEVIARYTDLSGATSTGKVEFNAATLERFGPREYAVLKSLSLEDENGNQLQTVRMGQSIAVRIEIDFKQTGSDFEVGVGIANSHGVYVHYFISNWEGLSVIDFAEPKTISVNIPNLSLFPGSYNLAVWVKKQRGSYDDAVHEALAFEMEEAAIASSHAYFAYYSSNSQVYVSNSWQMVKSSHAV